jgi:excisionase family DNA binding protein
MSCSTLFKAPPKFLTVGEVANALGVSTATIRRLIRGDELKAHKFGRVVRISCSDLDAYVQKSSGI